MIAGIFQGSETICILWLNEHVQEPKECTEKASYKVQKAQISTTPEVDQEVASNTKSEFQNMADWKVPGQVVEDLNITRISHSPGLIPADFFLLSVFIRLVYKQNYENHRSPGLIHENFLLSSVVKGFVYKQNYEN